RNHVFAGGLVIGPQPEPGAIATPDLELANLGVDNPDELHTRSQVVFDLVIKLRDQMGGETTSMARSGATVTLLSGHCACVGSRSRPMKDRSRRRTRPSLQGKRP